MKLKKIFSTIVHPRAPYSFRYSTQNPSHFPTPTGKNTDNAMWFTMRWQATPIGVRLVNKGSISKPAVEITIYAKKKIDCASLLDELAYRFEWYEDYSEFYAMAEKDDKLAPILKKFRGMRAFCAESLYEYLMIAILLQNANVKRTTQMAKAMLENYGDLLEFDRQKHYCFWTPERILRISEDELRSLKVGYRAKSFLRASEDYLKLPSEIELRKLNNEELRKVLLDIYGVGPASVDYLMRDVFHRKDIVKTIPPWEAKIWSRIFFGKPASPSKVQAEINQRYKNWRAVAVHYLFMDLNWRHREKPIEWFGKLMPY
jgi:3-methyladenine DNA glycosylase/8-oxoguanine DNA glycosylase